MFQGEASQTRRAPARRGRPLQVAVIGAGASGIGTAINLRKAGIEDVTVFEKAGDLGGTWRDNTYPGVACDIPSHLYRYSFAPHAEWTSEYSPGAEIHDYFRAIATSSGVAERIRFGHELARAEFGDGRWRLETSQGDQGEFDAVVVATGVLHTPRYPEIEGRDSFAGPAFHTSRWDHSVRIDGRRVGIVGTGSTATQLVPAIVDRVAAVTLWPASSRPVRSRSRSSPPTGTGSRPVTSSSGSTTAPSVCRACPVRLSRSAWP